MTDSVYLRGPRPRIQPDDYDEANEADTATVTTNGRKVIMSVNEFRKRRPSRKRFVGGNCQWRKENG